MGKRTSLARFIDDDLLNGAGGCSRFAGINSRGCYSARSLPFCGIPAEIPAFADRLITPPDKNSRAELCAISPIGGRGRGENCPPPPFETSRASFSRWNPYYVVNQNVARSSRVWLIHRLGKSLDRETGNVGEASNVLQPVFPDSGGQIGIQIERNWISNSNWCVDLLSGKSRVDLRFSNARNTAIFRDSGTLIAEKYK